MERVDTECREDLVPETICLMLKCFDLVIGSFHRPGRDSMVLVGKDFSSVGSQGLGKIIEQSDTGFLSPWYSFMEVSLSWFSKIATK